MASKENPRREETKQTRKDPLPPPTTRETERMVAFANKNKSDMTIRLLKERGTI